MRTFFRSYRMRFVLIVNAKVSIYYFFEIVTNLCAYNSIFGLSLVVFACFVKFLYRKSQLDDNMLNKICFKVIKKKKKIATSEKKL